MMEGDDDIFFVKRAHLGWAAIFMPNGIHVLPVEDSIVHMADDCVCGPRMDLIDQVADGDVWMHVHHSLDGRERYERQPGTLDPTHVTEEEPNG